MQISGTKVNGTTDFMLVLGPMKPDHCFGKVKLYHVAVNVIQIAHARDNKEKHALITKTDAKTVSNIALHCQDYILKLHPICH